METSVGTVVGQSIFESAMDPGRPLHCSKRVARVPKVAPRHVLLRIPSPVACGMA